MSLFTPNIGEYNHILSPRDNRYLATNTSSIINFTPTNPMTPKQVKLAVFTITRDEKTNEIRSTKFIKELWVEQKNGTSIDLIVARQLDKDYDPETTVIKVLSTVSF